LAPVIDDVIYYPDLIKVKVDLVSKNVIGWEASSYAYNHTERENQVAKITKEEAKSNISSNLEVKEVRLCVIPLDYAGEVLAYEFSGTYNNFRYYLYVDANTGSQVRVLRVIQTDQGELLL
jgi:germination protein YpeB